MRAFLYLWFPLFLSACGAGAPSGTDAAPAARLFEPGLVSTAPAAEVRLTISPDGKRLLFGRIGAPDAPRGWDIFESVQQNGVWSTPVRVSFNSPANDFDPAFAPDGKSVLFFSNRPGGEGGDDIWRVAFDPATGDYGEPANLGPDINTVKNEWAPLLSADGKTLLFSSDGWDGEGGQDLFESQRSDEGWARPVAIEALNTELDDFDAVYLDDDLIVFSRGDLDAGPVKLFIAQKTEGAWSDARLLPEVINCSESITNGPSVSKARPDEFYWSGNCPDLGIGRMDIFEIDVSVVRSQY